MQFTRCKSPAFKHVLDLVLAPITLRFPRFYYRRNLTLHCIKLLELIKAINGPELTTILHKRSPPQTKQTHVILQPVFVLLPGRTMILTFRNVRKHRLDSNAVRMVLRRRRPVNSNGKRRNMWLHTNFSAKM